MLGYNAFVEIRSPNATRPWQHVLEPLSGYLHLATQLIYDDKINGEAFNFGPKAEQNRTVQELLSDLSKYWGYKNLDDAYKITDNIPFKEAGLLKLNCDKALNNIKWESNLDYSETIRFVSTWYYDFYNKKSDIYDFTLNQINEYEEIALKEKENGLFKNKRYHN